MTPLVLVHGFLGGSAQWAAEHAAHEGNRDVISVDLPGFGANAHLPEISTIGGFADWVMATLQDLGIKRYHLLGHSMGGMIVQEMARRDPEGVQRLVLYATSSDGALEGRFETFETSKARTKADGALATARRIAATWFFEQEEAEGFAACSAIAEQASFDAMLAGYDAMKAWSGAEHLASLAPETLVLWGEHDRTYRWPHIDTLWTTIPHSHLGVVPGCAHAVHLEKPQIFNALLADFLSD